MFFSIWRPLLFFSFYWPGLMLFLLPVQLQISPRNCPDFCCLIPPVFAQMCRMWACSQAALNSNKMRRTCFRPRSRQTGHYTGQLKRQLAAFSWEIFHRYLLRDFLMEFTEVGGDPSKGVQYYHSRLRNIQTGKSQMLKSNIFKSFYKDLATNTLYENVIFLNIL